MPVEDRGAWHDAPRRAAPARKTAHMKQRGRFYRDSACTAWYAPPMRSPEDPEPRTRRIDAPSNAAGWNVLDAATLRLVAAEAAARHNGEALAALTVGYLSSGASRHVTTGKHTLRAYATSVRMLVAAWRDRDLLTIDATDARLWLDSMRTRGAWHQDGTTGPAAPATIRVRLAGARALYQALCWAGVARENPFADLRAGSNGRHGVTRRSYTAAEIRRLLAIADDAERALILLAADTGLRVSEICGLQSAHIDLRRCTVTLVGHDGTPDTAVAIAPVVRDALAALLPAGAVGSLLPWTDSGARKRIRRLCTQAEISYRGTDALRPGGAARSPKSVRAGQGRLFEPFAAAAPDQASRTGE